VEFLGRLWFWSKFVLFRLLSFGDHLSGLVVRLPGCRPRDPGFDQGAARFSEYQWVWNGVHSALVRINEELLERKVAAPVYKTEINDRGGSAALTT
jgi:hypothetical protein